MKLILVSSLLLTIAALISLFLVATAKKGTAALYKKKPLMHEAELKLGA